MLPILEIRDLSEPEARQRAIDLSLDAPSIEIVRQKNDRFTVRAIYPEGTIIPGATAFIPDNGSAFEISGLNRTEADEEITFFRDSGAAASVQEESKDIFKVRISPPQIPALVEPAPLRVTHAPDIDGYVFCLDRIRTERRPGMSFGRTVSYYQAYFDRKPLTNINGMAVERQGPDDNGTTGVTQYRRIAAGIYPLFAHASARYRTVDFSQPANIRQRPWPCIGVEGTGARTGILIHCAAGYLMSTGCINLTSNVIDAKTNLAFFDSWARVKALIDSIRHHLGGSFPLRGNGRLPQTSLLIRQSF